jgi:formamidopyrimidine-DNA glycosylase
VPEVVEVELYARALAAVVGQRVVEVDRRDELVVPDADLPVALAGVHITGVRRHGKLLLMHTDGPVVGWHFGMTGRLVVGDRDPVSSLAYGPRDPADGRWDRLALGVGSRSRVRQVVKLSDPRRFARVVLAPNPSMLGPDVWSVGVQPFRDALRGRLPVKAALLDQHRLAGLGNMLADELLWRAGIDPSRPCDELSGEEVTRLHSLLAPTLDDMLQRGGSHAGDVSVEQRRPGGICVIDGEPLRRRSIGGRTTWSCPRHQR